MNETNVIPKEIVENENHDINYMEGKENKYESIYSKYFHVLTDTNPGRGYFIFKRIFDFVGALFGITILSPLLIIVAILIKLEDPTGKVIFSQKRAGINGTVFKMYKFRSMVSNAEEILDELKDLNETTGAMFKITNDPRITKIGKFIRKTSIDELPQLWNVLKGEMSLVGPRPPLLTEVDIYTNYELQRLSAIPGCTGLWQATVRNSVGFKEMVEIDLLYIKKRTIFLEFKIIIMTFRGIFNGH